MKWLMSATGVAVMIAFLSHYILDISVLTFVSAAVALVLLSIILGDATEQLTIHIGQGMAGFVNVSLSNLAELIIIFVAIKSGYIELVQAGIAGSVVGNLLLILGLSIYFGCRKHGTLKFNKNTASLLICQLFIVATTLLLPTLFDGQIADSRKQLFSNILALMLVGAYVYYYRLYLKDERFRGIEEQSHQIEQRWNAQQSSAVLAVTAVAAFFMSEFLVGEVGHFAKILGVSQRFVGFILLPLLGNISEHSVAVRVAMKRMTELVLNISVGSASQVGMIVAPCAVFFGVILGNRVTLDFSGLPIQLFIISSIGAFFVLWDGEWTESEGVMLVATYIALMTAFAFSQ